jgi:hypothetical protein
MVIDRSADWNVKLPPTEHFEEGVDDSQAAIDILEKGLEASAEFNFSTPKVQPTPDGPWIPIGKFLNENLFHMSMTRQKRFAIMSKYSTQAMKLEDRYDEVVRSSRSVESPLFEDDEEIFDRTMDAAKSINELKPQKDLAHEAMHGSRIADPRELAAGDYERN